jgi:hypothetical protein
MLNITTSLEFMALHSLLPHRPGLNILTRIGGLLRTRLLLSGGEMNSSDILFVVAGSGIRG